MEDYTKEEIVEYLSDFVDYSCGSNWWDIMDSLQCSEEKAKRIVAISKTYFAEQRRKKQC